jgi:hypothetical protein
MFVMVPSFRRQLGYCWTSIGSCMSVVGSAGNWPGIAKQVSRATSRRASIQPTEPSTSTVVSRVPEAWPSKPTEKETSLPTSSGTVATARTWPRQCSTKGISTESMTRASRFARMPKPGKRSTANGLSPAAVDQFTRLRFCATASCLFRVVGKVSTSSPPGRNSNCSPRTDSPTTKATSTEHPPSAASRCS